MQEVSELLVEAEARLERMLASGWRQAAGEADGIRQLATQIDSLGLAQLATRLQQITDTERPEEALHRIAVGLAALRLTRARLHSLPEEPVSGELLQTPQKGLNANLALLAPARVEGALRCVAMRVYRSVPTELVLLEIEIPEPEAPVAPERRGPLAIFRRPKAAPVATPWMRAMAEGELRWQASQPMGSGVLNHCAFAVEVPLQFPQDRHDLLSTFREHAREGKLADQEFVFPIGGPLRVLDVHLAEVPGFLWCDPTMREAFVARARDGDRMVAWLGLGDPCPLALLQQGRLHRQASFQPLIPGYSPVPLAE